MSANSYVADAEAPSWHSGTGLVDDVVSLSEDVSSGSWVAAGLDGFGTAMDVAATVSDPLGSAIAAGIGFILDHLDPLKSWLDDLTGNPGQVQANAATYGNVAKGLGTEVETLGRLVSRDLEGQSGQVIAAYEAKMASIQQSLSALSQAAGATSTAMGIAGTIVQVVHDMVRDAISQIVGSAVSYAAELVCTLGAATPLVIEQVTTRVSELATKIGTDVKNVVKSADSLKDLMTNLDKAVKDLEGGLKDLDLPKGADVPGGPGAARNAGEEGRIYQMMDGTTHTSQFAPEQLGSNRELIDSVLAKHALDRDSAIDLINTPTSDLTDAQRQLLRDVRDELPSPDADTVMQKVIPPASFDKDGNLIQSGADNYILGNNPDFDVTNVRGSVSIADNTSHLGTPEQIRQGLRLDYDGTPFTPNDAGTHVIRFRAEEPNFETPYNSSMGGSGRFDSWTDPFTGNGFTKAGDDVIPEHVANNVTMRDGAEMWEVLDDGTQRLTAVLRGGQWMPQGN